MANINGTAGADLLLGNGSGTGNDLLRGFLGADTYQFSTGNGLDVISEEGDASSSFIDRVLITDKLAAGFIFSRSGTDLVIQTGATDEITISRQFDTTTTTFRVEQITDSSGASYWLRPGTTGSSARDVLTGTAASESINAGGSSDIVFGGGGNDTLNGAGGNDVLAGGDGDDSIAGGNGVDTASYADASAGVKVVLSTTTPQNTIGAGIDTLSSIENVSGSRFSDTLTGSSGANVLTGGDGDDALSGAAGADTELGGAGADTLYGGAGNDVLNGGDGIDTASYAGGTIAVTVNLAITGSQATGGAGSDTLISIENLTGTTLADTLTGNAEANLLSGTNGNDVLIGGAGDDTLNGGSDIDTASYADTTGPVAVSLAIVGPQATGSAGTDSLISIENLTGGSGADSLTGNSAGNILAGNAGDDVLIGGAGNDTMDGGSGNDVFRYVATAFGSADVGAGQADSLSVNVGDRVDFSAQMESLLKIGGASLASLSTNTTVGANFDAGTNVRFTGGHLQIDVNNDQQFTSAADFDVALTGASGVTYDAAADEFSFSVSSATKKIALTFDDGPNPTYTPQVLSILDKYGVHATFFEIGEQLGWGPEYSALAATLVAHGNLVENHTFTHPSLISLSNSEIITELQTTTDAIFSTTGTTPTFFRPPYGDYNATVESIGNSMGMKMALWTIDTNDWNQPAVTVDSIVQTVIGQAADQSIVLMHDGGGDRSRTVAALDQIIPQLQSMGYEIVTLDQIQFPTQWLF